MKPPGCGRMQKVELWPRIFRLPQRSPSAKTDPFPTYLLHTFLSDIDPKHLPERPRVARGGHAHRQLTCASLWTTSTAPSMTPLAGTATTRTRPSTRPPMVRARRTSLLAIIYAD